MQIFLTAVRFLVNTYENSKEDHPLVTGADLKNQLDMTDEAVARIGKLTALESMLCSSSGEAGINGYASWQCRLGRAIRYFDGVTSIEKYLEKIDQLRRPSLTIIKPQDNSKQNNKDKSSASAIMRAFSFQNLVHDLLKNLGYRVVPEQRIGDAQVNLLAYYPITSPIGIIDEKVWIVETKYRNLTGKLGADILYRLVALTQEIEGSNALLVLNSTLTKAAAMYASKRSELGIWMLLKLLSFS